MNEETGTVSIWFDGKNINALIDRATKARVSTLTIDLSTAAHANSVAFNVEFAKSLNVAGLSVTIKLPRAEITLTPESLDILVSEANELSDLILLKIFPAEINSLTPLQTAQINGLETIVSIDVFVDGKKTDAPLTVSLAYDIKQGEDPKAIRVWHLDAEGNLTDLDGTYSRKSGMLTFFANHQSYFVAGYDPVALWVNGFNDVKKDDWFYGAAAYANYYGLFIGDTDGHFMPYDYMTRAMFVTVLWSMDGRPLYGSRSENYLSRFSDVSEDEWYYNAVIWAVENGIANGFDGNFEPNAALTHQEMAVLMNNYAKYKGSDIPCYRNTPRYIQNTRIELWAKEAVFKLCEAGVMGNGEEFKPRDYVTRAEAALMFKNFLRLVAGKN